MPSRPIHPSQNYLALKSRTAAKSPYRPRHHRLPLPAVSFIEGFRTPATVQAASLRSAGIRNPQHFRTFDDIRSDASAGTTRFSVKAPLKGLAHAILSKGLYSIQSCVALD